jgi:hypothetical protein
MRTGRVFSCTIAHGGNDAAHRERVTPMKTWVHNTSTPYAFTRCGFFADGARAYRAAVQHDDGTRTPFATVTAEGAAQILAAYFDAVDRQHPEHLLDADGNEISEPAYIAATVTEYPAEIWLILRGIMNTRAAQ